MKLPTTAKFNQLAARYRDLHDDFISQAADLSLMPPIPYDRGYTRHRKALMNRLRKIQDKVARTAYQILELNPGWDPDQER